VSNVVRPDVVLSLDDPRLSSNLTLSAAVQRVAERATLQAGKASHIFKAYADPSCYTRAQICQAEPSGTTCVKGHAHPSGPVFCAVMPKQNNPRCECDSPDAADCSCKLAAGQRALMSIRGGPGGSLTFSGIEPVEDEVHREAVAEMALQLGLTSAIGAKKNVQVARVMIFPVADYKLREDCDIRKVTLEDSELESLKAQSAVGSAQGSSHQQRHGPKSRQVQCHSQWPASASADRRHAGGRGPVRYHRDGHRG
jgi:hypothetical protein